MKILILDDDEMRHRIFKKRYDGHEVFHAKRFLEFASILENQSPFDLIHLDHDLGDHQLGDAYLDGWGNAREYNGLDAARMICELEQERTPLKVVVQSVNPAGSRSILQTLERREIPVLWDPFSILPDDELQIEDFEDL